MIRFISIHQTADDWEIDEMQRHLNEVVRQVMAILS